MNQYRCLEARQRAGPGPALVLRTSGRSPARRGCQLAFEQVADQALARSPSSFLETETRPAYGVSPVDVAHGARSAALLSLSVIGYLRGSGPPSHVRRTHAGLDRPLLWRVSRECGRELGGTAGGFGWLRSRQLRSLPSTLSSCGGGSTAEGVVGVGSTPMGSGVLPNLCPRAFRAGPGSARKQKTRRAGLALSAPDRIRTCDLRFRRPTLYPAELRRSRAEGSRRRFGRFSPSRGAAADSAVQGRAHREHRKRSRRLSAPRRIVRLAFCWPPDPPWRLPWRCIAPPRLTVTTCGDGP